MEKRFDEIIVQCVGDGLEMLGSDGKSVVLWLWQTKSGHPNSEIASHIMEFSKLLNETFGMGAVIIESHIAEEIMRVFSLNPDFSDLNSAVQMAKQKFDSERK